MEQKEHMYDTIYLMENDEETSRLEMKTDPKEVRRQALWAGLKPGMRVADIGCGPGITTAILHGMVQPCGTAVGIDSSIKRITHARERYGGEGVEFACLNILAPLDCLGKFDFVWVRFLLEYYNSNSFDIVRNISRILKPGGILCLIDLDHNCLNHFGLSPKLEKTIAAAMKILEEKANFDPYVGRKLYSFLYDLCYQEIDVKVGAHHLIFGELKETDAFNWLKKIKVVSDKIDFGFEGENWGYEEFVNEFNDFFLNARRFTYSPVISCRGLKP
ncbi:MAG: class I SAM-dependent methyltransferase [Geobacteraceae bacterium]